MRNALRIFGDRAMLDHDPGPYHPESPDRLRAILAQLKDTVYQVENAPLAEADALKRVHDDGYVDAIFAQAGQACSLDPDTHLSVGSVDAARYAAGAALAATEHVLQTPREDSEIVAGFALCRPPGHHAISQKAMGFCVFNNLAVGIERALMEPDIHRVLVVDWDVHHGNGTESQYYHRSDVVVFDTHRDPFYPGTGQSRFRGAEAGEGYTHNVTYEAGASGGDLGVAFDEVLPEVCEATKPDIIFVAAGFDAHEQDPLGGLRVTTEDYAALCAKVAVQAKKYAQGRMVLTLEGGYHPPALAESVHAVLDTLRGASPPPLSKPTTQASQALARYRSGGRTFSS